MVDPAPPFEPFFDDPDFASPLSEAVEGLVESMAKEREAWEDLHEHACHRLIEPDLSDHDRRVLQTGRQRAYPIVRLLAEYQSTLADAGYLPQWTHDQELMAAGYHLIEEVQS